MDIFFKKKYPWSDLTNKTPRPLIYLSPSNRIDLIYFLYQLCKFLNIVYGYTVYPTFFPP